MPSSGAKKRRRQKFVRLHSVVIKGLLVQRLFSHQDPQEAIVKNEGCPLGYSVVCFAKHRLVIRFSTGEVPCTFSLQIAGMGIDLPAPFGLTFSGCFDGRGLNSMQINNLRRNASETHYRGSLCANSAILSATHSGGHLRHG